MKTNLTHIRNLFTPEEVSQIRSALANPSNSTYTYEQLGRLHIEGLELPTPIIDKIRAFIHLNTSNPKLEPLLPPLYVKYSAEYGTPHLPPHYDRDTNSLIVDYQLGSSAENKNVSVWPLGSDLTVTSIKDNEALIFNPNETIHWRPIKDFQPGEYVEMIFFRFYDKENLPDYSHLPDHPDDEVFREVRSLRESFKFNA